MYKCSGNLIIIGTDKGLSHDRRQAINFAWIANPSSKLDCRWVIIYAKNTGGNYLENDAPCAVTPKRDE